jgi:hypothetical protein
MAVALISTPATVPGPATPGVTPPGRVTPVAAAPALRVTTVQLEQSRPVAGNAAAGRALVRVQGQAADEITGPPVKRFAAARSAAAGFASGQEAAGGLGAVVKNATNGLSLVTGPVAVWNGVSDIIEGVRQVNNGQTTHGVLEAASGVSGTTSGVAATTGAIAHFAGAAGIAATAGVVAGAAGGAAAVIDGVNQVVHNWDDRTQDHQTGAGLVKTAAGTAMMVGAGLVATGVGAPIGVALMAGGAVVSAATYLAENTEIGRAVTGAIGTAAHFVADTVSNAASAVGNAVSGAWKWATGWL